MLQIVCIYEVPCLSTQLAMGSLRNLMLAVSMTCSNP